MGYFGSGQGSEIVYNLYGNIQVLKGCDTSMTTLSNEVFGFIHHLV
jgi:hypothetical protein